MKEDTNIQNDIKQRILPVLYTSNQHRLIDCCALNRDQRHTCLIERHFPIIKLFIAMAYYNMPFSFAPESSIFNGYDGDYGPSKTDRH